MKLQFKTSKLEELYQMLGKNPEAVSVLMSNAELVAIYDELISKSDYNAILVSGHNDRKIIYNGLSYKIIIT